MMLTVGQERSPLIEIDGGDKIWTVTFTANGEYIVGGGASGLRVWRVKDGKQMTSMAARGTWCLAVSRDGRWIAAGTFNGYSIVWDAKTFEKVFTHKENGYDISGVDFSPDSTRLLTAPQNRTASVWDVEARKKVLTLDHEDWVRAAKYSLQGGRIATATSKSVRVWDSNDARLLVEIPVTAIPLFSNGLLWSNKHLFVVSDSTIKQLEASTGSTVSEWLVTSSDYVSCVALPQHVNREFIAHSTNDTVTFLDTSTHIRIGLIQHTQTIRSIALSPDNRFLAINGNSGKIAIKDLSDVSPASYSTVSIVHCRIIAYHNDFYCQSTLLHS